MRILFPCSPVVLLAILFILPGCTSTISSQLLSGPGVSGGTAVSQPITVSIPIGPETGNVGQKLTYSFDTKSSLGGKYTYGFDWGDDSYSWETSSIASHSWADSGIYTVRVQARCGDVASSWSIGKVVMIGSSRLSRRPLGIPGQAIQYVTPDTPEIKSAVQSISWKWKGQYSDFDACREWVATNIKYKSDQDIYNAVDYWQFPVETLERGTGDCEDIAILLCSMLRAIGVPANQVYVAVGGTESSHAYIVERYSKGVWNIIEPQLDSVTSAVSFTFLDWAVTHDYSSDLYCFNDKYFFRGPPAALASGVYDINMWHSFWPFFLCASDRLQKQLNAGEKIECSAEWLNNDKILFDWSINIYGPADDIVFTWGGTDIRHEISFPVTRPGMYSIEIVKRDYAPRNVRLITSNPGWQHPKD